jgi:flagellar biosynthesis protein FlhF
MQIKRFEGADMTETLRLVKEEFGENAVILSAKQIRCAGFFKGLRKKSVEVTAAIDTEESDENKKEAFSGLLNKQLNDGSTEDRVTLTSKHRIGDLQKKDDVLAEKDSYSPSVSQQDENTDLDRYPKREKKEICSPKEVRKVATSSNGPFSSRNSYFSKEASHRIVRPFYHEINSQKRIAFVGGCGAGKSASIAKLALHCSLVEKMSVAMISLDRFSIGGNGFLEAVSRMMNLPFCVVYDPEQLRTTLDNMAAMQVVLIDTPGLNKSDETKRQTVHSLLRQSIPDEIHWVANATVRQENHLDTAEMLLSMGVDRLLFTHVDEVMGISSLLGLSDEVGLPLGFYTDGTDLFDNLQEVDLDWIEESTKIERSERAAIQIDTEKICVLKQPQFEENHSAKHKFFDQESTSVVVNKNSELFHDPECKSVKQLDRADIKVYSSMEKAVEIGLKPCLICCRQHQLEYDDRQTDFHRHATAT